MIMTVMILQIINLLDFLAENITSLKVDWIIFSSFYQWYIIIGLHNGLVPSRHQAIM